MDLSIEVSFLSDLAGQMDRLASLDPSLLQDFSTAFQALDGRRAAQKAFFRATDTLFDGLEQGLGLNATALDDEAAIVKQGVQRFFQQVQQYDHTLSKISAGSGNQLGQTLHKLAIDTLHAVQQSDATPVQRQRWVQDLLAKIGDDTLDRPAKNHLGHLFKQLLHGAARGHEGTGGRGSGVARALAKAVANIAQSPAPAPALRGPIETLGDGISQAEPLTASLSMKLAASFAERIETCVTARPTEMATGVPTPESPAETPGAAVPPSNDSAADASAPVPSGTPCVAGDVAPH